MKRIFTLMAVCLLTAFAAQAQVTFKPGIRGGVNFASIRQTDFDSRTDFYVGGLGAIKFSRVYTMQPEITYSRQGAQGEIGYMNPDTGVMSRVDTDIEIQYLSFALMNKFTFSEKFDVHVGPTLDFETGSNVNTNVEFDMGIMAGVGYTFPFGLTLEARVKKGIIDVLETDDYEDDDFDFAYDYNTNFVFQIGGSYTFDITGRAE